MNFVLLRRWVTLTLAGVLWGGCAKHAQKPACQLNSDCPSGQACHANKCVTGCDSDRDCPANLRCLSGACDFPTGDAGPPRDAGVRDAGGASSGGVVSSHGVSGSGALTSRSTASGGSSSGVTGTLGAVEDHCGPTAPCDPNLSCSNLGALGSVCLAWCNLTGDGGVSPADCETGRECWPVDRPGKGVCLRTAARDQSCMDNVNYVEDPLLVCEPGLSRLKDSLTAATLCTCKLLCPFAACPGASCACGPAETCVSGVVQSATLGACGTVVHQGDTCGDWADYPYGSSQYCEAPAGIPAAVAPLPLCFLKDYTTFIGTCMLMCAAPNQPAPSLCPMGQLCLDGPVETLGAGFKTCQALPIHNDGGMVTVPDAAGSDASTPLGWDAAAVDPADAWVPDAG